MAGQKRDDQLEHTYSNYVRIRDIVLKTCKRRWTIGRSGERGSGISVLAVRHDDDDVLASVLSFFSYMIRYKDGLNPYLLCVLVLECSFSSRLTLGVLLIQSGVSGKMLSCILFSGIFDSCRVDIIRRPKGFIVFYFLSKCCLYFGLKVQS